MTNSFGLAALVWVVLSGTIAPGAESRTFTSWRARPDELRQPLQAYAHDSGSTARRSLNDVATGDNSSACAYAADTSSYCIGAVDLCNSGDEMGAYFRGACQTTCKICRSASAETELPIEQGETVVIKTGFVLLEGSQAEQRLHDGFLLWLEYSGAGGAGIPVGDGFVTVGHSTEYAEKDENCESYHAAARRLIEQQISLAIIQSHTCKVNLSATFHDAGVLHLVQTGTDMVSGGEEYRNSHSWYLYLSSDDYPRLFLKHLSYIEASRVALMSKNDDAWTRTSASRLQENIVTAQANGKNDLRIVQTFNYTGDFASAANEDPGMWRDRLQDMANAPSDLRPDALVVYSRAEGEMIMRQVANIKMPLRGVYITGASSWEDPDNEFAEYVVTPGQWAADVRASCSVFGTNANYVELFTAKYGYEPDYKVAMSTAAGVVFQLALQQAGTSRVSKIMEALSLLSAETIAGRVRFSYQQRNIGRDPILMQYQAYDQGIASEAPPKLLTVLPMDIATGGLEDFVDIRCRIFMRDDNPDVCSDEERAVFEWCFEAHPEKIQPYSRACLDRITAEEIAKAQGQGQGVELQIQPGETVEIKTGFVLLEGSQAERRLHDGFLMWLEYSGAGGAGIPVADGFVKVGHSTEYAKKDENCESYHAAARRLIEQKISYAIIQSHACKVNLSATFHDAGVLHFVQTGTDMVSGGEEYRNSHSWYLYLSSNDYPRLFLKHLSYIKASRLALMSKNDDAWTRTSASRLQEKIIAALANGEQDVRVVQTFNYTGAFAAEAYADPGMWRDRLQDMANAPSDLRPDALVVYSRAEGEVIMRQVANIKMPLRGVYITGASSWEDPDNGFAEYVVTPGQWAADVRASCRVFGTNANYVDLFTAKYGYEPDYKVAMSTAAGVVFQLALQQAGNTGVSKIMEALSLLSAETIAGRVRFSYQQRNIGRDPILMQYQAYDQGIVSGAPPELLTVLPMDIATGELEDFVDIRCRIFMRDDNPDVCSDEERAIFQSCFEAHPEKIQPYSRACLDRITAEEIAKAQGQGQPNLAIVIPAASAAVVVALIVLAVLYVAHSRWKNSASYFRRMMRKNPPGTMGTGRPVTLVVTDIEDSTAMWDASPDHMDRSLAMHNSCLRDALKECYGYEVCTEGDSFTVAFHEAQDALQWCCIVQERLQRMNWPEKITRYAEEKDKERLQNRTKIRKHSLAGFLKKNGKRKSSRKNILGSQLGSQFAPPKSEDMLKGNVIPEFCGIRVRMGVHTAPVDKVSRHPVTNRVMYPNEFVRHTTMISDTPCGGQVVMSSQTLAETEPDSGSWFIMHLGAHILEEPLTEEQKSEFRSMRKSVHIERMSEDLFMMVPNSIANRMLYYPPIKSVKQVAGGYLQAPSSTEGDIVIAFAQVHSLASMVTMFDKDMVDHFMRLLRDCVSKVLGEADGYECEENGGIFVFAFPSADCAMKWATEVQEAMLKVDWPPELLRHPACETWIMAGQTMFRGPRLKVGMAKGPVLSKQPSSVTGRAVYRGPILNHAARVKSKASAGQVVLSNKTWEACTKQDDFVEVDLGTFGLKGVEEAIHLFQISKKGSHLQYRSFAVEDKFDQESPHLSHSDVAASSDDLHDIARMPSLHSSNLWASIQSADILSPSHQEISIIPPKLNLDAWGEASCQQEPLMRVGSGGNMMPGSSHLQATDSTATATVSAEPSKRGKKKVSSVTRADLNSTIPLPR